MGEASDPNAIAHDLVTRFDHLSLEKEETPRPQWPMKKPRRLAKKYRSMTPSVKKGTTEDIEKVPPRRSERLRRKKLEQNQPTILDKSFCADETHTDDPSSIPSQSMRKKQSRSSKVRFTDEVDVQYVASDDDSRVNTDWHKNLTPEGRLKFMSWKRKYDNYKANNLPFEALSDSDDE